MHPSREWYRIWSSGNSLYAIYGPLVYYQYINLDKVIKLCIARLLLLLLL